jgi:hypothetical protein
MHALGAQLRKAYILEPSSPSSLLPSEIAPEPEAQEREPPPPPPPVYLWSRDRADSRRGSGGSGSSHTSLLALLRGLWPASSEQEEDCSEEGPPRAVAAGASSLPIQHGPRLGGGGGHSGHRVTPPESPAGAEAAEKAEAEAEADEACGARRWGAAGAADATGGGVTVEELVHCMARAMEEPVPSSIVLRRGGEERAVWEVQAQAQAQGQEQPGAAAAATGRVPEVPR